jgi:hypothetical protein
MGPLDLRYSAGAKLRDSLVSFAVAMILGTIVAVPLRAFVVRDEFGFWHVLALYVGAWAPLVLVAGIWRWGRAGRIDADGATMSLSRRGPVLRLAWSEVSEIFRLRPCGFELRGVDVRIRFSADFDGAEAAALKTGELRGSSIVEDVGRRFDEGVAVRFRGPMEFRAAVGWGALLVVVFLPALAAPFWAAGRSGEGAVVALFLAAWLGVLLAGFLDQKARACGWVEVGSDGIASRRSWSTRRCRWEELAGVKSAADGVLEVLVRGGRPLRIEPTIANIDGLERILRAKLEGLRS